MEKRFNIIKDALKDQPYIGRIFFKENDAGEIDVADILSILMMFNLDRFPDRETFPTISYSGKKQCIDSYIKYHKEYSESIQNPYVKMKKIMPDIFKLYDKIETNMNNYYRIKNPNGRYGATKGVLVPKQGTELKSKFFHSPIEVQSPNGSV